MVQFDVLTRVERLVEVSHGVKYGSAVCNGDTMGRHEALTRAIHERARMMSHGFADLLRRAAARVHEAREREARGDGETRILAQVVDEVVVK